MGTAVRNLALASLGNHLYAAGGYQNGDPLHSNLAIVEVFTDDNVTAAALQLA